MRTRPWLVGALFVTGAAAAVWSPVTASADEHRSHRSKKNSAPAAPDSTPTAPVAPVSAPPLPPPPKTFPDDGKPIATALMSDEDLGARIADEVLGAFAAALGGEEGFHYRDAAELLDPPDEAVRAITEADQGVKDAQAAFDEMDLENARGKAEASIKVYTRHLPLIGSQEGGLARVRDAWIRLAAVRFFDGNNDAARDALRHVFVYDPQVDYTPRQFPPQMKKMVLEGRLMFDALGTGKISVTSTPPGAAVYLNGRPKGLTPLTIDDAPAGPNQLVVVKRGFQPATPSEVEVQGGGDEAKADIQLARYDRDPFAPFRAARPQYGALAEAEGLLDASKKLRTDLLVVVQGANTGAGTTLTASLYDARPRQLLRKLVQSGSRDHVAETARKLATDLFRDVRLDGKFVAPPPTQSPLAEKWQHFRQSNAFWYVVGGTGAVLVAGAAVGIGVGVGERHGLTPAEQVILFGSQPSR